MPQKIPCTAPIVQFLVVVLMCSSHSPAQAPAVPPQAPVPEDRTQQILAFALDRMAAGDPETALRALRPVAGSANHVVARSAQCLMGAAMGMNGEIRSTEQAASELNAPVSAAVQAAWKQVLPECARKLSAIAPRVAPERRAGLFYYLGLVGTDESEHIRYLREAAKGQPAFSEASYQLALHLMRNSELDEAAALFRRVAEQKPEWSEPRAHLGMILLLSGRASEAVKEFQEALRVRPESGQAHGQLGLAFYLIGDYDGALNECGSAVRMEVENPFHHNCAALTLLEKNRAADAVAHARRAAEISPNHETYQIVLAASLLANGQESDALAAMKRAVTAEPRLRSDPARLEKGNLLRNRALALVRQLLQKIPG